ncbi:MAG: hypothetical protein QXG81_07000, partial [Ignisphaera sp.]
MPSHELHARWAKMVCGASFDWIDKLVDSGPMPKKRTKSVEEIVERYERGLMCGAVANIDIERGVHDSSRLDCSEFM